MSDNIISIQFDSNIAKGNDAVRISFYANIGFFIELAQMFEFNLRKLICYERAINEIGAAELTKENVEQICARCDKYYKKSYRKCSNSTFGRLIAEAKDKSEIPLEFFDALSEINRFRVQLVHRIFQNNIELNWFESADHVSEYTTMRLIPMIEKADKINKEMLAIIEDYRTRLHVYKSQVGILLEK